MHQAAELLHIESMLERRPGQMSGGQRQRVAVARAIAMQSQVLLMDEPLSNLDALLRLEMRAELKRLLAEIGATTIYVTHDQIEALSMGDRIAVMRDGILEQVDQPMRVYDLPTSRFVGGFIGNPPMNFMEGQVQRENGKVEVVIGDFRLPPDGAMEGILSAYVGKPILLGLRAAHRLRTLARHRRPGTLRHRHDQRRHDRSAERAVRGRARRRRTLRHGAEAAREDRHVDRGRREFLRPRRRCLGLSRRLGLSPLHG